MATITDEHFEGSYPPSGYTETDASNHLDLSTVQAYSGTHSMRVNSASSGAIAYIEDAIATKVAVGRFYFRIHQNVSATSDILTLKNASGAVYLRMLTTRVIRLTFSGTTNYAGPTLSLDTWYCIDFRADATGASVVFDWKVNSAAQTQRTFAQTSANFTAISHGCDTTATCDLYFDDIKITDTSGDYPLGAYIIPKSGAAGALTLTPTITAVGKKGGTGAAGTLTGTPTINRAAQKGGKGAAGILSDTATMAAAGVRYEYELHSGAGSLSTSATLTGAARKGGKGAPSLTLAPTMWGGGTSPPRLALSPTLSLVGQHKAPGQGSIGLTSTITAAGRRTGAGAGGSLDVTATLTEVGQHGALSAPTMALDPTLSTDAERGASGAGTIALAATVTGAGTQGTAAALGSIDLSVTLTATGVAKLKPAKPKVEGGRRILERLILPNHHVQGPAGTIPLQVSMSATGRLKLNPVIRAGAASELSFPIALALAGEAGGVGSDTVRLRERQQASLLGLLD